MTEPAPGKGPTRFAPVVLAGLVTAGLTCVAASKPWFEASVDFTLAPGVQAPETRADSPLALALGLVVLAAWGVLLVSRTRGRRIVAAIGALADAGAIACGLAAPFTLPDQVREQLGDGFGDAGVSPTAWYVVALVAAVLALPCLVAAWVLAPRWPTMSSRYDAPTGRAEAGQGGGTVTATETELWKAMDQGRDPTDPEAPSTP